jgi:Yip1 domain
MFFYRIMGAVTLDAGSYEGIEADRRATPQAALVVLLSSASAGLGAAGIYGPRPAVLGGVVVLALVTWLAWGTLVHHVGSRWLAEPGTRTNLGELLRTTGFSAAPGLLQALAVFPNLGRLAFVVAWLWMLAAMVVAVKHALDFRSTARAIVVCLVAATIPILLVMIVGALFGPSLS